MFLLTLFSYQPIWLKILEMIYIIFIGSVLGSFFMMLGYRIPRGETLLGRSHCEHCHTFLRWYDLIPLVSFLIQKGKCRYCLVPIGVQYFLFELLSGLLILQIIITIPLAKEALVAFLLVTLLLIITVTDGVHGKIPNFILLPFLIIGLILRMFVQVDVAWWFPLIGFITGFMPLFLLGKVGKNSVGGGDIKFLAVLGIFVGPINIIMSLFLSSILAIFGHVIITLITKKKQKYIRFGPFIALGTWILYSYSQVIMNLVLNLF